MRANQDQSRNLYILTQYEEDLISGIPPRQTKINSGIGQIWKTIFSCSNVDLSAANAGPAIKKRMKAMEIAI
jgi:hypothetical protein